METTAGKHPRNDANKIEASFSKPVAHVGSGAFVGSDLILVFMLFAPKGLSSLILKAWKRFADRREAAASTALQATAKDLP